MGRIVGENNLEADMSKKFARLDEAAAILEISRERVLLLSSAVGAICQLPEIMLINMKKVEDYMKHLYKVPGTERYVKKLYVRIGEGSVLLAFIVSAIVIYVTSSNGVKKFSRLSIVLLSIAIMVTCL